MRTVVLVAVVAFAWLGMFAHNQLSLPLAPLSAENLGPLVVYAALGLWYARSFGSGTARAALAGWTLLNLLVGGVLTVLPLPFLPFVPEQTIAHYAAHVLYSGAQLPLLAILAIRAGWSGSALSTAMTGPEKDPERRYR